MVYQEGNKRVKPTRLDYCQYLLTTSINWTLTGHTGGISSVLLSPNGICLAVASFMGIWLYNAATYQAVSVSIEDGSWILSIAFSPDGLILTNGSEFSSTSLSDTVTGAQKVIST